MEKKEPIRKRFLALRDGMEKEERDKKSSEITERVLRTRWYEEA